MRVCVLLFGFSWGIHNSRPDDIDEDVTEEYDRGEEDHVDVGGEIADDDGELQLKSKNRH